MLIQLCVISIEVDPDTMAGDESDHVSCSEWDENWSRYTFFLERRRIEAYEANAYNF